MALSLGAHPSSTPDTTLRDLCPILSLVGACHLPAMRAQEFTRASLARQPLSATSSRVRAANHEVCAASSRYAPPIASRDVRASRQPPAALPSPVELGAAASGSQATACVARHAQNRTRLLSRTTARSANGIDVRHHDGVASLLGSLLDSLPDAMPCRTSLDDFCGRLVSLELRSRHCVRRTRPRLATARKGVMAWSRRRAPALVHAARARRREQHSASHLCAVSRPAPSHTLSRRRSCACVSACVVHRVRRALLSHAVRSGRRRPGSARTYCSHVISL